MLTKSTKPSKSVNEIDWNEQIDKLLDSGLDNAAIVAKFQVAVNRREQERSKKVSRQKMRRKMYDVVSEYISDLYGDYAYMTMPVGDYWDIAEKLLDLLEKEAYNSVYPSKPQSNSKTEDIASAETVIADFVKNL